MSWGGHHAAPAHSRREPPPRDHETTDASGRCRELQKEATAVTFPVVVDRSGIEWALLTYRVPREPSTPRIAIWRRLKGLGVAQIGDGLVALPADSRTQEQLEWVAEQVEQAGGRASVWRAYPTSVGQERRMATEMAAARAAEYGQIREKAMAVMVDADPAGARSALTRLRSEQRRIERRDHFPPPARAAARAALRDLAARSGAGDREPA